MLVAIFSATVILSALYALLISHFAYGWRRLEDESPLPYSLSFPSFSIIVPARNEYQNIRYCIEDIIGQVCPTIHFEIIVVDDFSNDETPQIVEDMIKKHPEKIRLIKMANEEKAAINSFKKAAIETAIRTSRFDWIITTDADCRRGTHWLASIASCIVAHDPVLVSGPVQICHSGGFFPKAQSIEFMGLIGIGAASIGLGMPNMCNGANLIYKKEAFITVGGFNDNIDIASGDDEFLMQKIHARWPNKIHFLKNRDAIVYTGPATTLGQFIGQRKRWVSKSRKYTNKNITLILTGAWLFHLCMLLCLAGSFSNPWLLVGFAAGFGIKVLAEYIFLNRVSRFFKNSHDLIILVPAAFLYIFYVVFIGIYGNFGNYKWKGRAVK